MSWRIWIIGLVFISLAVGGVSAFDCSDFTSVFQNQTRYVNKSIYNGSNSLGRTYYQRVQIIDGNWLMYYSDNTNGTKYRSAVANSSNGINWTFRAWLPKSGHPYVHYDAGGHGAINNKYILYTWDENGGLYTSRNIYVYYSNDSYSFNKSAGWINFTWMNGASAKWDAGTYGVTRVIYNASKNNSGTDPFNYQYTIFWDCTTGAKECEAIVGATSPVMTVASTRRPLINWSTAGWDLNYAHYASYIQVCNKTYAVYTGGSSRVGMGVACTANYSTFFTKYGSNPIIKRDAYWLNQSAGSGSWLLTPDKKKAYLYVAGRIPSGGQYNTMLYTFDVKMPSCTAQNVITIGAFGNGTNLTGSTITVYNSTGGVVASGGSSLQVSAPQNSTNYAIKIKTNGNSFFAHGVSFDKLQKALVVQAVNFSGTKPDYVYVEKPVIASNFSGFSKTTLVYNITSIPNYICYCGSWNLGTASCSTSWSCNSTNDYEHNNNVTAFWFNVTHFSAYVVGSGAQLTIWDDTNDVEGQNVPHYQNQFVGFYANYSNSSSDSITPGMGGYCQFIENSGGWSTVVNMSYNATSRDYYIDKNITASSGSYLFNVTCKDSTAVYGTLSLVDGFDITPYVPPVPGLQSIQWGQVFWWTAETVAHSLQYGIYNSTVACDQLNLFYVEPPPINGVATKLNTSTDVTGQYKCQNSTQGTFTILNDGTVGLNVSVMFDQITSGVRMKIAHADAGWQQTCSGGCNSVCDLSASCLLLNTTYNQIAYNIPQNGSKQYWMWADFKGVAGTYSPTKGNMTTNATKYVGG